MVHNTFFNKTILLVYNNYNSLILRFQVCNNDNILISMLQFSRTSLMGYVSSLLIYMAEFVTSKEKTIFLVAFKQFLKLDI